MQIHTSSTYLEYIPSKRCHSLAINYAKVRGKVLKLAKYSIYVCRILKICIEYCKHLHNVADTYIILLICTKYYKYIPNIPYTYNKVAEANEK